KQWPGTMSCNIGGPFGRTSFLDRLTHLLTGFFGLGSMASISIAPTPTIILVTPKSGASKCAISSLLTNYVRPKQNDSVILVQNAEELLDKPTYVAAIDAIAKEDLMFGLSRDEKINSKADINHSTRLLEIAQRSGKAIFVVEYLKNSANIEMAKKRMHELGFVLYVGQRGLANLAGDGIDDNGATEPTQLVSLRCKTLQRANPIYSRPLDEREGRQLNIMYLRHSSQSEGGLIELRSG